MRYLKASEWTLHKRRELYLAYHRVRYEITQSEFYPAIPAFFKAGAVEEVLDLQRKRWMRRTDWLAILREANGLNPVDPAMLWRFGRGRLLCHTRERAQRRQRRITETMGVYERVVALATGLRAELVKHARSSDELDIARMMVIAFPRWLMAQTMRQEPLPFRDFVTDLRRGSAMTGLNSFIRKGEYMRWTSATDTGSRLVYKLVDWDGQDLEQFAELVQPFAAAQWGFKVAWIDRARALLAGHHAFARGSGGEAGCVERVAVRLGVRADVLARAGPRLERFAPAPRTSVLTRS